MTPFPDIRGHNNFGFQAVRENGARFLRGQTEIQQVKIARLSHHTRGLPRNIGFRIRDQIARLYDRYLPFKLPHTVIAVPGRFLTIRGQPVTDDLM